MIRRSTKKLCSSIPVLRIRRLGFNGAKRAAQMLWSLAGILDDPHSEPERPDRQLWDVAMSFYASEDEMLELTDRVTAVLCGNEQCGEFGESCVRQWIQSAKSGPVRDPEGTSARPEQDGTGGG